MSFLSDIEPKEAKRVMDLVRETGLDVSDWAQFKGGAERAASNPRYCYEWSFVDSDKNLIVLNLWHRDMEEQSGTVIQRLNLRKLANSPNGAVGVRRRRAVKMDFALQKAARESLSIRVIICEGSQRTERDSRRRAGRAEHRLLDTLPWHVSSYDWDSGDCVLVRGKVALPFIDQFDLPVQAEDPKRRIVTGQQIIRSPEVRRRVLERASGKCEWCGCAGFRMENGGVFLETHHIVPLSEKGPDSEGNVAALCPNHHREAHYGIDRASMQEQLQQIVTEKRAEQVLPADQTPSTRTYGD
ncbi:HNH endonuclease [Pseudidiomarina sp.]|uniref:HNH endonuclease n=1 Tax=Pseudidiomarina sp. TaxID=2081707 RepID=UPI003A987BA2